MGSVPAGRTEPAGAADGPQTFRSPTAVVIWWVWLLFAAANLVDLAVQGRDHFSLVAAAILVLATGVAYVAAQRPRIIADRAGIMVRNPLRDHHIGWAGVTQIDLADLIRVHCDPGPGAQHGKVISAWAVHYSRRHQLAEQGRARREMARLGSRRSTLGLPYGASSGPYGGHTGVQYGSAQASPAVPVVEAEAEKVVRILREYATAARAEIVWAGGQTAGETGGQAGDRVTGETGGQAGDRATDETKEMTGTEPVDLRTTGWLEPLTSTWSRRALAALIIPALILLVVCLV
jgi:Bacterial PH domain